MISKGQALKTYFYLLLILNVIPLDASVIEEKPIEKYIEKADLIIIGKVSDIEMFEETLLFDDLTMSNGVVSEALKEVTSIYTTYTIEIDEVLSGLFTNKIIKIKVLGGCSDNGECVSLSSNFHFAKENKVLMLLNYDELNDVFRSTANSVTAYRVYNSSILVNSNSKYDNVLQNGKGLTIDELKSKIMSMKKAR